MSNNTEAAKVLDFGTGGKFAKEKINYDESFDRRCSGWHRKLTDPFLSNVFNGHLHTNLILAETKGCLARSEKLRDHASIQKLKTISENYDYTSLDGHHRSDTIRKFLANELSYTGYVNCPLTGEHTFKNTFFKDMPMQVQSTILHSMVSVSIEKNLPYRKFNELYRNVNSGEYHTAQEIRNSRPTPIATLVRTIRAELQDQLSKTVKASDVKRMGDDELVVKMMIATIGDQTNHLSTINNFPDLDWSSCDAWYEVGEETASINSPASPYDRGEVDRAVEIIKDWGRLAEAAPSRLPRKDSWIAFYAAEYVNYHGISILNSKLFFEECVKLDKQLHQKSEKQYGIDTQAAIDAGEDPEDVSPQHYYFGLHGRNHQGNRRRQRRSQFHDLVAEELQQRGYAALGLEEPVQSQAAA